MTTEVGRMVGVNSEPMRHVYTESHEVFGEIFSFLKGKCYAIIIL